MRELEIEYMQTDPQAKADSSVAVNDMQPFGSIQSLRYDGIYPPGKFATLEHNYWLLDDSFDMMTGLKISSLEWSLFSTKMSGGTGQFSSPIVIDVVFGDIHKFPGLTLLFYPFTNDYADKIRVTWYNMSNGIIHTGIYSNNSVKASIKEQIADCKRIKIELLSTNHPYRFLKLYAIEYGIVYIFPDGDINSARVFEEIDSISNSLSVNTLNFNILKKNPDFTSFGSIPNEYLMKNQKLRLSRNNELFGFFFLQKWKDKTLNNISFDFNCVDAIGIMQNYEFLGGMYRNTPAEGLIAELFEICFPTRYIIYLLDPAFANETITGYMPIMNCREALQWICFSMGAIADASRRNTVWIYPRETETMYNIPRDKVYRNGSLETLAYISQVNVTSHSFTEGGLYGDSTLFEDALPVGAHRILTGKPVAGAALDVWIGSASITETHVNYIMIKVTVEARVTLRVSYHGDSQLVHSVKDPYIASGEIENIISFEDCTIVNRDNAERIAKNIYNCSKKRIMVKTGIVFDCQEVGYIANVGLQNNMIINGTIKSLDIDLRSKKTAANIIGDILPNLFCVNTLPMREANYIWLDDAVWDDNKFWIDGIWS